MRCLCTLLRGHILLQNVPKAGFQHIKINLPVRSYVPNILTPKLESETHLEGVVIQSGSQGSMQVIVALKKYYSYKCERYHLVMSA